MAVITESKYPFIFRVAKRKVFDSHQNDTGPGSNGINSMIKDGFNDVQICLVSDKFKEDAMSAFKRNFTVLENIGYINRETKRFFLLFKNGQTHVVENARIGLIVRMVTSSNVSVMGRSSQAYGIESFFFPNRATHKDDCYALLNVGIDTGNVIKAIDLSSATIEEKEALSEQSDRALISVACVIFSELCEIKANELPPKSKTRDIHCKYKNDLPFKVTNWDLSWYTRSLQNHPFVVRGFWRMQAHGEKMKERKLIFVDSFLKGGYTKGANKPE